MFFVHQKCFHAFFASNADMLSFVLEVFSANYLLRKSCKKGRRQGVLLEQKKANRSTKRVQSLKFSHLVNPMDIFQALRLGPKIFAAYFSRSNIYFRFLPVFCLTFNFVALSF